MFSEEFIPAVLEEVGRSGSPWRNLGTIALQYCVDDVYQGDYTIEADGPIVKAVSSSSCPASPTRQFSPLTIGNRQNPELPKCHRHSCHHERPSVCEEVQDARTCRGICQVWPHLLRGDPLPIPCFRLNDSPLLKGERWLQGGKQTPRPLGQITQCSPPPPTRLVRDCSRTKQSWTPCYSTMGGEAQRAICQLSPHLAITQWECSHWFAPQYVLHMSSTFCYFLSPEIAPTGRACTPHALLRIFH